MRAVCEYVTCPSSVTYRTLSISVIVENTYGSEDVSDNEGSSIRSKTSKRIRLSERYFGLRDNLLIKLGKVSGEFIVNVQFKKRKSFKGYGPAKKRQCGEGTYERSSNAESPGRETSYQDNANSVGWYVGQRSRSNLKYEVGALDVAINPVG
ncbi:predicted protein [Sclerotinia sclerotiorum 1980 UF-70]|uniref:Uncharacterized protein n=1 Tax=Sclerotinia sclerotiorum (strain ATCC 18683 / 1980 / Ss-1) TaxID=665079 RepID=A7EKS5_SCLS1|nr:predicted protein [Sclerotinia sclerotiorum 1980 UF-70]EDO03441.1 predicted protein [Sclerotinia sclerotiorum 1980 UF-70]